MCPTTEPAIRVAKLFHRRLTTHWNEREVKRYRQLMKDGYLTDLQDIELIERYYAFQRKKGDLGIHRRDLYTFLNNLPGELDRARAWELKHKKPARYKETNGARPCSDQEFQRIGELARAELERFKTAFKK